jgi:hypothetical protein
MSVLLLSAVLLTRRTDAGDIDSREQRTTVSLPVLATAFTFRGLDKIDSEVWRA